MNQKHYLDLGSDVSSIWNFCAYCPDIISRGNHLWHCKMSAVFSGYPITTFFWKIEILNLSSHTVGMKLQCINAAINPKIQYDGTANSHAQPILVSVSFLFLRYLTTKHSILRNTEKRPDTDYTRGDYWGNFNYCNHIAIGHMDIVTELQY